MGTGLIVTPFVDFWFKIYSHTARKVAFPGCSLLGGKEKPGA